MTKLSIFVTEKKVLVWYVSFWETNS